MWFSATTDTDFHIFLKRIPDTTVTFQVQNPESIFIVWKSSCPDNSILNQASKIKVGQIQVADTTSSISVNPPRKITSGFTKTVLKKGEEIWGVQYVCQFLSDFEEAEDNNGWSSNK